MKKNSSRRRYLKFLIKLQMKKEWSKTEPKLKGEKKYKVKEGSKKID